MTVRRPSMPGRASPASRAGGTRGPTSTGCAWCETVHKLELASAGSSDTVRSLRMEVAMIALLLAAQVAALEPAAPPRASQSGACGYSPVQKVADRDAAVARKLGDLPKAHHEIAVMRTEGGCPRPVIVRYNVGR